VIKLFSNTFKFKCNLIKNNLLIQSINEMNSENDGNVLSVIKYTYKLDQTFEIYCTTKCVMNNKITKL